jgi:hypothetical protein
MPSELPEKYPNIFIKEANSCSMADAFAVAIFINGLGFWEA